MLLLTDGVVVSSDALFKDFDGESVILNLVDESYYGLDPAGTTMWNALTQTRSLAAACDQLMEIFDVERGVLEKDLLELADELVSRGIFDVQTDASHASPES
jgi:hypothetical protein